MTDPDSQIGLRMPKDLRDRLLRYADGLSKETGLRVTLADAARKFIKDGLDAADKSKPARGASQKRWIYGSCPMCPTWTLRIVEGRLVRHSVGFGSVERVGPGTRRPHLKTTVCVGSNKRLSELLVVADDRRVLHQDDVCCSTEGCSEYAVAREKDGSPRCAEHTTRWPWRTR